MKQTIDIVEVTYFTKQTIDTKVDNLTIKYFIECTIVMVNEKRRLCKDDINEFNLLILIDSFKSIIKYIKRYSNGK